jgi:hypothetical protein
VLGADAGAAAAADFDALLRTLLEHGRRPLMRHGLRCKCFGGDESAFANMIAAAAGQDREDALLFASTLMTGHAAWAASRLAEAVGQAPLLPAPTHPSGTIHKH